MGWRLAVTCLVAMVASVVLNTTLNALFAPSILRAIVTGLLIGMATSSAMLPWVFRDEL